MAGAFPLHPHVTVSPRFTRSVALLRDFDRPDSLDGYILTPTGRGVLGRLADALRGESPASGRLGCVAGSVAMEVREWTDRNALTCLSS